MTLTDTEKASPLWIKIKEHIEERIEKHRSSNDKTQPADATEKLRGKIAELNYLRNLDKERPQINEE
jgi:hypothetical protein